MKSLFMSKLHVVESLPKFLASILPALVILSLGSCVVVVDNTKQEKKATEAKATDQSKPAYNRTTRSVHEQEIEKPDWEGVFEEDATPVEETVALAEPDETLTPPAKSEPAHTEPVESVPPEAEMEDEAEIPVEAEPLENAAASDKEEERPAELPAGSSWEDEFIKDMESIKEHKQARSNMSQNLVALFPVADEIQLGEAVAARTLSHTPEVIDEALWEYVSFVGLSLVEVSPRNDLAYYFVVLDDQEINAFAAPGGYIFITVGAIKFCENEAELAAMLAHEVAHVGLKHGLRALDLSKYRIMSEMMVVEMDEAFGSSDFFDLKRSMDPRFKEIEKELAEIADQCYQQTQNPYGQDLEREADKESLKILSAAGYNPFAAITLMQRLVENTGDSPDWEKALSSHPPPSVRVEILKIEAQRLGLANKGALNEDRFQSAKEKLK